MLEAISDFWKPIKKSPPKEKLRAEQLQIGTTIGFGIVPQASLSGRKLSIAAINTYQFGDETLTSFVLSQDKDAVISMIVAESEGEQYLAISRRLSLNDRMKMFDSKDLEKTLEKSDAAGLPCKDIGGDFKGWMVSSYTREIQGMLGRIFKGDFRKEKLPAGSEAEEFKYTLLVSGNNEHAIEIEQYNGGRMEIYATVYRRLADISEVLAPARVELNRPDLKLASSQPSDKPNELSSSAVLPKLAESPKPVAIEKPEAPATVITEAPTAPIKLPELTPAPTQQTAKPEEKPPMQLSSNNNAASPIKPVAADNNKPKFTHTATNQEIKTVTKTINGLDNEAVECELKVANKIIDEAIRNEMRLSDVVRKIIELPVAGQETVHIPITLSDEDYSLLAIRYSMSPSDRSAIKARIIEDLNSFSGNEQKKKAA